jgi:hypothetical protein
MVYTTNPNPLMKHLPPLNVQLLNAELDAFYAKHLSQWFAAGLCPTDHRESMTDSEMQDRMLKHVKSLDEQAAENLLDCGWKDVYASTMRTLV